LKRTIVFLFLCGCMLLASCLTVKQTAGEGSNRPLVILDPGHGGLDGGAVAADGTVEKEINLTVSLRLRDMLLLMGYDVLMTRETDVSIHNSDAVTVRQKKSSDLHNRLKMASEHPDAVFLSIHQNNFSDTKQNGMCFYYSPNNEESRLLAECFHEELLSVMQPNNRRTVKAAESNLFILSNTVNPAVLVECGFLSNTEEKEKLISEAYQKQICALLLAGLTKK